MQYKCFGIIWYYLVVDRCFSRCSLYFWARWRSTSALWYLLIRNMSYTFPVLQIVFVNCIWCIYTTRVSDHAAWCLTGLGTYLQHKHRVILCKSWTTWAVQLRCWSPRVFHWNLESVSFVRLAPCRLWWGLVANGSWAKAIIGSESVHVSCMCVCGYISTSRSVWIHDWGPYILPWSISFTSASISVQNIVDSSSNQSVVLAVKKRVGW